MTGADQARLYTSFGKSEEVGVVRVDPRAGAGSDRRPGRPTSPLRRSGPRAGPTIGGSGAECPTSKGGGSRTEMEGRTCRATQVTSVRQSEYEGGGRGGVCGSRWCPPSVGVKVGSEFTVAVCREV